MSRLQPAIKRVTARIVEKSKVSRRRYLDLMEREADNRLDRHSASCSNLADAYAGALEDQARLKAMRGQTSPSSAPTTTCFPCISLTAPIPRK